MHGILLAVIHRSELADNWWSKPALVYHGDNVFSSVFTSVVYNIACYAFLMLTTLGLTAVVASAFLVASADALIKKIALPENFAASIFSPWMLVICGLYFVQILLAVYIFVHKGNLAIYGNVFVVFYAILMGIFGILFFKESLTLLQYVGIVLALTGAVLINGGL